MMIIKVVPSVKTVYTNRLPDTVTFSLRHLAFNILIVGYKLSIAYGRTTLI